MFDVAQKSSKSKQIRTINIDNTIQMAAQIIIS
jgi:hypothetical protein